MTTLTWDRARGHAHTYDVVAYGLNYRLDEVRAAVGLVQLDRLPQLNKARERLAGRYRERLEGIAGLTMPFSRLDGNATSAHHLAVVILPEGMSRPMVRASLLDRGVQTSVHYPPIHHFTAYAADVPAGSLPQTNAVADRLLTLPLFAHLRDEQVDEVADAVLAALGGG
jgi:dTDP-4-amino-4,6-dideoxygalactose transaminase